MKNLDYKYMSIAIKEAEKGKGLTYPNPAVGAVIVNNNKIISKGYHKKAGGPHAEVEAIKKLNYKIPKNSTIYVTLEPCSHFGKTPPCSDLIIKHNFKRVVIGILDPNPLVNGKGKKKMLDAGIEVIDGILEKKCYELNEDFFYFITQKKPFITIKSALTLDGKIATSNGDSKWITNEESRKFGHYLRKINSCIMIGTNTLKKDNPSLDIRLYKNSYKQNSNIIILDSDLIINLNSNVIKVNPNKNIYILTSSNNKEKIQKIKSLNINIVKIKKLKNGLLSIKQIINFLNKNNFMSVLIEGGGTLIYNLFKNKLVNKLHYIYAPKILGLGLNCVNGKLTDLMKDSIQIKNISLKKFGSDFMLTGYCE